MRLRYIAIGGVLIVLAPVIKDTIIYAGEVKSVYDQVQEIKETDIVIKLSANSK